MDAKNIHRIVEAADRRQRRITIPNWQATGIDQATLSRFMNGNGGLSMPNHRRSGQASRSGNRAKHNRRRTANHERVYNGERLERPQRELCDPVHRRRSERRTIRLGKDYPLRAVNELRRLVGLLNAAAISGTGWDPKTAAWVGELKPILYDKIAKVGLVPKRAEPEKTTLGGWLDSYIALRGDVKDTTATVYGQARRCLIEFFGASKPLADVTAFDADAFRIWLAEHEKIRDGKTVKVHRSEATVQRRCGMAKQFFRAAVRKRLIAESPFADMKGISVQSNSERFYFVTRDEADKVLAVCPDNQWQLLFALSRYGGLRCPSEHLGLRWSDINLAAGRMIVHSPKTEHHRGKAQREVPIFPELRSYLEDAYELADDGTEFVIHRYRDTKANLRTYLRRIVERAGLRPWPKLFQNMRSTRQTELSEHFPAHVVCAWMGNSEDVAREHYLQVTDAHFEAAAALHEPVQNSNAADDSLGAVDDNMPRPLEQSSKKAYCEDGSLGGPGIEHFFRRGRQ